MNVRELFNQNIMLLDGAIGTMLQAAGLPAGMFPEGWNLTNREAVIDLERSYFDVGSNCVQTNTFNANVFKFSREELAEIIPAAVANVKEAARRSKGTQIKLVGFNMGPLGKLMEPYGDLSFEAAYEAFSYEVELAAGAGADYIFIQTMSDAYETRAALLAAKEHCDLPVVVLNTFTANGRMLTGGTPLAMIAIAEGMGADAVGVNCSLGPEQLKEIIRTYLKYASIPVVFEPNAGLPRVEDGHTVFDISADEFAELVAAITAEGLHIVGACCGTSPEYIRLLEERIRDCVPVPLTEKQVTLFGSSARPIVFAGQDLNTFTGILPWEQPEMAEALRAGDLDALLEAVEEEDADEIDLIEVCAYLGEPGTVRNGLTDTAAAAGAEHSENSEAAAEAALLKQLVRELQAEITVPLKLWFKHPEALDGALRIYNGKALIRAVGDITACMEAVFPIMKKYGAVLEAVMPGETGEMPGGRAELPGTAVPDPEASAQFKEQILACAARYGVRACDIKF